MKKLFFLVLFLSIIHVSKAQENYSYTYGRITAYEADLKSYPKDENAEALIIYEKGTNSFHPNESKGRFDLYMRKSMKIKILKQAGVKYGEFEIPYYSDGEPEEILDLEGITYNYDNKELTKTSLDRKNIYDEKINEYWRLKKFAMPNVKEGSVIELQYVVRTPYFFNMREWMFQKKIPVVRSQLTLRVIPYYEYTYILKGTDKFDGFSSEILSNDLQFGNLRYKEVQYNFEMSDLPAFRDEEYISSEKDYMIGMNFQMTKMNYPQGGSKNIMTTWPEISDDFLKNDHFGKYIKSAEKEAKKILPGLELSDKTPKEQLKLITEYVKSNYNWDGKERKYSEQKLSDFLNRKTGSSAEINLFLIGLLKAAGIEVCPLLLSTRSNGSISVKHPFSSFFNYVIAGVEMDGEMIFIDGTESMLKYGELPERCVNVHALIVKPKSNEWIDLMQQDYASTDYALNIDPNPDEYTASVQISASGYDAYRFRRLYYGKEENLTDPLVKDGIEPMNMKVLNYVETDEPFIFSFDMKKQSDGDARKLFLAPFLNMPPSENRFKQSSRTLPVDLTFMKKAAFKSTVHIPKGYKIDHVPETYTHDGYFLLINYIVTLSDDKIEIAADYAFKKNIYEAKNYPALKGSFEKVVSLFNEPIVFVKE